MQNQVADKVMMVRPASFQFNSETAVSNAFQKNINYLSPESILEKAKEEFDAFVNKLRLNKIEVLVIQDTISPTKPDAIFPNNWISMGTDGKVFLFPMCTPNRRLERRKSILDELNDKFKIIEISDISDSEHKEIFLEGTGSIIFDHINKTAYACISPRTNEELFKSHCQEIGYTPICFYSSDKNDLLVYHTNVMLTIGIDFAIICAETIKEMNERNRVLNTLKNGGKQVIEITEDQMNQFAGNMLQLKNKDGQLFLVMSNSAFNCLTDTQLKQIEPLTKILSVDIPTIETIGGGSARCMMAEIFLESK
jgi:hypothetical protein